MPGASPPRRRPVLPPQYSNRLFRSSFTTAFSVAHAAHHELWSCAALALVVLLTSINYWRHPIHGWRRDLDMTAVFVGIIYHVYCSAYCPSGLYQLAYLILVGKTAFCYRQARRSLDMNRSSAWHCGVHVVGNVANMFLYSGLAGYC